MVLVGSLAERFSPLATAPLAAVDIVEVEDLAAEVSPDGLQALWSLDVADGVHWALAARTSDGALVFSIGGAPALVVDPLGCRIHLGAHPPTVAAQLVATIGAPAVAAALGAIPMHGSSAAHVGDGATVIVGPSGAGKSSLLSALTDAGWRPIAEDVTVVDLPEDRPVRAWPGPPWVRLRHGQAGPRGSELRPDPTDKVSWDLADRQPEDATDVRRIVVLRAPGGDAPACEVLTPAEALAVLPPHVAWLSSQPRATAAFTGAVALSRRVPVVSLRLPHDPGWATRAAGLLSDL